MGFMDAFLHDAGHGMIFARGSPARVETDFRSASLPESGPGCRKNDAELKDLGKITSGCRRHLA
jgi:hypothetical protein